MREIFIEINDQYIEKVKEEEEAGRVNTTTPPH